MIVLGCTIKNVTNDPKKPDNASKIFLDEVVSYLKYNFQQVRTESFHQSIDKAITKLKERCSMKQYMHLKPLKRGREIWQISDSFI